MINQLIVKLLMLVSNMIKYIIKILLTVATFRGNFFSCFNFMLVKACLKFKNRQKLALCWCIKMQKLNVQKTYLDVKYHSYLMYFILFLCKQLSSISIPVQKANGLCNLTYTCIETNIPYTNVLGITGATNDTVTLPTGNVWIIRVC